MRRLIVLGSTFLTLALAGCASHEREEEITKALGFFNQAAANTAVVRKEIEAAVKKADKTGVQLKEPDFATAEEAAKKLRAVGKQLLDVKSDIDLLKDTTTEEQKRQLAQRFGPELQSLFTRLEDEQKKLDEVLAQAQKRATPEAMEHLRKTLNDSREDFRILTKTH
jgi:Zn-dependent oligopeptidase